MLKLKQKLTPTLIAISVAIGAAGVSSSAALANDDVTAKFAYTNSAPVELTYKQFEAIAKNVCEIRRVDLARFSTRTKMEQTCSKELLNNAVKATQQQELVNYHAQMTAQDQGEPLIASRK